MILKTTTLKCSNCGIEFYSEYGEGGSIVHNNAISNIDVLISRFNSGLYDDVFLSAINLNGNFDSIKDNSFKVGKQIYDCVLLSLRKKKEYNVYSYLKSRECDIVDMYNNLRHRRIEMLTEEIKEQMKRII